MMGHLPHNASWDRCILMQLQKLQDGRDLLKVTHTHKLIAELEKEISLFMKMTLLCQVYWSLNNLIVPPVFSEKVYALI